MDFSEDRVRLGQLRMWCGAMATRGRISIAPISRIVLNTFVNIYAKFGAFIPKGNNSTTAPLRGQGTSSPVSF